MKYLNRSILTFVMALLVLIFSPINASENPPNNRTEDKIYLAPENVLITQEGIFYVQSNKIIEVDAIYTDCEGIYMRGKEKADNRCGNGHPLYHIECGGCANWWCNFRCKCSSPWGEI
jgi:hypothetical protein